MESMIELTRTIRFCLNGDGTLAVDAARDNSYASWPGMKGLGRYYELAVTCEGEPDGLTGYFINIKEIDQVVREQGLPIVSEFAQQNNLAMGEMLRKIIQVIDGLLGGSVLSVGIQLTPTYTLTVERYEMDTVLISQRFSFSAAHRLHVESYTDEQNQQIFNKCNNPNGHGHNYWLEVTVAGAVDQTGQVLALEELEGIVGEQVIERFDHKHLNLDTKEFAHLNPSVENIAMVIYQILAPAFESRGVHLDQVKVWETEKTVCTYRGV